MTELPPNPLDPDEDGFHLAPPRRSAAGARAAAVSLRRSIDDMGLRRTARTLAVINQPEGFDCPGCAWPEAAPGERHHIEFCENGAKAVAEEATTDRVEPIFFAEHSVADLATRSDYWLGQQGRLTPPMVKRPGATNYTTIDWDEAFALVADELRGLDDPDEAVFYTSGRTSNEAAFAYQLLVRAFGTNNLPDCSNMCHEATGVALGAAIGIGKGSVRLEDFVEADVILVVGQNPGTNHPRMLGTLGEAKAAGATIVAINPLPEAGLLNFKNPQRPSGIIGSGTALADLHLPIRLGGDQALFQLWSQRLLRRDAEHPGAIDRGFIDGHTHGFEQFAAHIDGLDADALLAATGLDGQLVDDAFEIVAGARRMIVCWAMGITQHRNAVETIREITTSRSSADIRRPAPASARCAATPTCRATARWASGSSRPKRSSTGSLRSSRPSTSPRTRVRCGRRHRRIHGRASQDAVLPRRELPAGDPRHGGGRGGHRALPADRPRVDETQPLPAICGDTALILPTLGRTKRDRQLGGDQFVTVEDSDGKGAPIDGGTPTGQPPPAQRDGDRDGCGRGAPRPLLRHRLGRVPPRLLGGARTHQPGRAGFRGLQRADRVAGRVRAPPPAS